MICTTQHCTRLINQGGYNVATVGWEGRAKCTNKATPLSRRRDEQVPRTFHSLLLYILERFEQTSISSNPNLTPQCFLINILSTVMSAKCYIENLNNA